MTENQNLIRSLPWPFNGTSEEDLHNPLIKEFRSPQFGWAKSYLWDLNIPTTGKGEGLFTQEKLALVKLAQEQANEPFVFNKKVEGSGLLIFPSLMKVIHWRGFNFANESEVNDIRQRIASVFFSKED